MVPPSYMSAQPKPRPTILATIYYFDLRKLTESGLLLANLRLEGGCPVSQVSESPSLARWPPSSKCLQHNDVGPRGHKAC